MLSRYRVSRAAIELIKRFEGYRRKAAQLPDGRWTIGYGHTLTAREGAEVSEPDAEALLLYDLISVAHAVNENVYAPLTQNQYDALCSFAFNLGIDNFRRSQVLKRLNAGAPVQAACAMELWRKAEFEGERIVVDALVRRRAVEKALFLTPANDAWVAAPSSILRPLIDLDGLDLIPLRRPREIETTLDGDRVVVRCEEAPEEAPEVAPEPAEPDRPAVSAAAEAVTARLEALFADPGAEPEPEAPALLIEDEDQLDIFGDTAPDEQPTQPVAEVVAGQPSDLSPESEVESGTGEPSPAFYQRADDEPRLEPADELEIPETPSHVRDALIGTPRVELEVGPFEFIPARNRPPPRPRELSVVWDLLLALSGLAFFGFGVFWGLAQVAPTPGPVTPLVVAWSAGLAGVGFLVVAVYRLLQRLGREAERD